MYILSTAYLCFHVKATLFETVYLFMVGSVMFTIFFKNKSDLYEVGESNEQFSLMKASLFFYKAFI